MLVRLLVPVVGPCHRVHNNICLFDNIATSTTSTTTPEPTTLPPSEVLYAQTSDYHWDQFHKNSTKKYGGWKAPEGLGQGPFGFGKSTAFKDGQCLEDSNWEKNGVDGDGNQLDFDPCMWNPENCTDGISFSVWEQMVYSSDVVTKEGGFEKRYVFSTGADFKRSNGQSWPGIAILHEGPDLVAVVSTGKRVWELRVTGQLMNNTWVEIGIRFKMPDLRDPKLASKGEAGLEKMGGLEMFINLEKVGQTILPESTERGSTMWIPQPRLTKGGVITGKKVKKLGCSPLPECEDTDTCCEYVGDTAPVMFMGCHQNAEMKELGKPPSYFAGNAQFDEIVIWKKRLAPHEVSFFLGGYSDEFADINADQFGAMLGNVDLGDASQAAAAQAVLQAMLMGPPTTIPPFPTRTRKPNQKTTLAAKEETTTLTTTTIALENIIESLRKKQLGTQAIMSSMLSVDAVSEGQDPEEVEGRFSLAIVASALLTGNVENKEKWDAVHKVPHEEGAPKTVRELENYMVAWVGSVNTSAENLNTDGTGVGHWKTEYFDSGENTMKYATKAEDMVLNVDKIPIQTMREDADGDGKPDDVRQYYPDYTGWEWDDAKALWDNLRDNFTVPTGMYQDQEGCNNKPLTILTALYNGLGAVAPHRRNPVKIRSKVFKIDSKVISVRVKANSDPVEGDITKVYKCEPDKKFMKWNPVKMTLWHKEARKAKRTLLWHKDDYWEGLEVRHCVWWNEKFGTNGAWDTVGCEMKMTSVEKSECWCSPLGSYAVLAELLEAPDPDNNAIWIIVIKWMGIIIGTITLSILIFVVFFSVVVGEMFHQIRMYSCLAYLIANIIMMMTDMGVCDGRHSNMAISMMLMYFYQAAMWWNMCEAHATFKGVTSGLINGRTKVYAPIAWGLPLICIGFLCFWYGELLGTHPFCFISWEKPVVRLFFIYNSLCFFLTFIFVGIVIFNIMRVQSHNKDTVAYLKDQVKGHIVTSILFAILWCYGLLGSQAYMRNPELELPNLMPLFQIINGWFGVILFLLLGVWSKRFMVGLHSQAAEKREKLQKMKEIKGGGTKYEDSVASDKVALGSPDDANSKPSTAAPSPASSRPASPATSRPVTAATSRPATAAASRPTTAAASRPVTVQTSQPPSTDIPVDQDNAEDTPDAPV